MKYTELLLAFDGACSNNSKLKLMGVGLAVYINGEYSDHYSQAEGLGGPGTSNIAEWDGMHRAVVTAAQIAKDCPVKQFAVTIQGDSQLVIYQMTGKYSVKSPLLKPLFEEAKIAEVVMRNLRNIKILNYEWVRREFNTEADRLSNVGLDKNFS